MQGSRLRPIWSHMRPIFSMVRLTKICVQPFDKKKNGSERIPVVQKQSLNYKLLWSKLIRDSEGWTLGVPDFFIVFLISFLPDLKGHHVLVGLDSMTVVVYINHRGGLSSRRLFPLVEPLLEWAQPNLRLIRAKHVPGKLNQGAALLS